MKKNLLFSIIFLCLLLFWGCGKSDLTESVEIGQIENHVVSLSQARAIAQVDAHSKSLSLVKTPSSTDYKSISNVSTIKGNGDLPSFYVVNYADSGFAIVSGDDRLIPVLAYSDNGKFPVEEDGYYPAGLVKWMSGVADTISHIRRYNLEPDSLTKEAWFTMQVMAASGNVTTSSYTQTPLPACTYAGQEATQVTTMGPLLSTQWGQGVGYNDALNNMGCPLYSNQKPPTGCVATATAQIMKFHEWPNSFNWSAMPLTYGSGTTAALMKDIGQKVDMDWGCDGSGTSTSNAATALKNHYNYKSANYADYNYLTVQSELFYGYPVILSGGRKDKWLFFNVYADGHAWVADGVQKVELLRCENYIPPDGISGLQWRPYTGYLYFHMNWGWGSGSGNYNGYYSFNNFNPGTNTFNYKTGMITQIRPNK